MSGDALSICQAVKSNHGRVIVQVDRLVDTPSRPRNAIIPGCLVDAIVVGKFVGVDALAAIGATGSFNYLILGFVIGLTSGFSVIIAQRFGAGDEAGVKRATAMSVLLSAAITVIITAVSTLLTEPVLAVMPDPEILCRMPAGYMYVIFGGTAATLFLIWCPRC